VNKSTLLSQVDHKWHYIPPRPWTRLVNSGLLFLSKYKITDQDWEQYKASATTDRFAAKGIGFITIELEDAHRGHKKYIQVFGTHMQAGASYDVQTARKAQAKQASAYIQRHRDPHALAIILAGDLNIGPEQDPDYNTFSVHYADEVDARARCMAYESLRTASGLHEVQCEQQRDYAADICRFLLEVRDPQSLTVSINYEDLKGPMGESLSDTRPMCLTMHRPPTATG
jgi:endonuclease/exonuclease/phosphatase family metal-dependent hydrolase